MAPARKISRSSVLRTLSQLQIEGGKPPTIEELRVALGVGSTRTVLRYLQELEEAGDIERWSGARGIRLTRAPSASGVMIDVPVVGAAPAGPMLEAQENILGHVRLAPPNAERRRLFLLRVKGNSMDRALVNGRSIDDGDLVLVAQTSNARSGEVIVAMVDGQATIKRLSLGPHYAVLKPESSDLAHVPFVVSEGFSVQGVVIDVIKQGATAIWN